MFDDIEKMAAGHPVLRGREFWVEFPASTREQAEAWAAASTAEMPRLGEWHVEEAPDAEKADT